MNERKRTAGLWVTAAFFAPLLYPLSFGPACWISERTEDDGKVLSFVYKPLIPSDEAVPQIHSPSRT